MKKQKYCNLEYNKKVFIQPIIFLLSVMLLPNNLFSQQITYTYDASGNRIKREYSIIQNPGGLRVKDSSLQQYDSNMVSIKAYPNPFKDQLTIEIEAINPEEQNEVRGMQLYSISGQLIEEFSLSQNRKIIQTNHLKPGKYFIRVFRKEETQTFMLIKN